MVSEDVGQPNTSEKTREDQPLRLYQPGRHKPPSGRGYEGASPWSSTPLHAPYEQSFITVENFPGQRFWTWGMFALLEKVGEDVLNELRADSWEPWNNENRELFLFLENQFAQTLIIVEAQGPQRYWAKMSDLEHARCYPVLLTYQSEEVDYPHMIPPEMVLGTCALVSEGSSFHLYTVDQLGEDGRTLCAQIREGMLLFPPDVEPSEQERRQRVGERIARWEKTHQAAQHLASLYWSLHQQMRGQIESPPPRTLPTIPVVIDKGALIASALPVQAIIEAYSNAQHGAYRWMSKKEWPTYAYSRAEGTTHIQVRPSDPEVVLDASVVQSLWQQVRQLSDIDGDVLLTMIAQAIAAPQDEKGGTWITSTFILDYRGIKPITKKEQGRIRRAGHRQENLANIASCVNRMNNTWITVEQWIEEEPDQKKRGKKPRNYLYTRDSRLMVITDVIHQQELREQEPSSSESAPLAIAWRYQLGSWLDPFLQGANRQVAWLLQQVLRYDPYHQMWEKRLGRYVTFHMRMNLTEGTTTITREIGKLLEELSLHENARDPERTRQRLEKALNRLEEDHIISAWIYAADNPKLPPRKWLKTWLQGKIQVTAETFIHQQQQPSQPSLSQQEGEPS